MMGPTMRHGPHHGAQKSTIIGVVTLATSSSNVASVRVFTALATWAPPWHGGVSPRPGRFLVRSDALDHAVQPRLHFVGDGGEAFVAHHAEHRSGVHGGDPRPGVGLVDHDVAGQEK